MVFVDYYSILKISSNANLIEVKSAYRNLAKILHPDVSKDDDAHEKFILLNEAYIILSNESSRRRYDIIYQLHFAKVKAAKQNVDEEINNFSETQQQANYKAQEVAKLSLDEILDLLKQGTKEASSQMLNVILLVSFAFLGYQALDIFFVKEPNYFKIIVCAILAIGAFIVRSRRTHF